MPLPNFLCVGTQKAGTTTLHDILSQHPDIYLPNIKETNFFQDNNKYKKGIQFYEKYFINYNKEKVIGEIDPIYMYYDYVPERIYKSLGKETKLIFILRNPVDRAYSHYLMSFRKGYETETFEKAIYLENKRLSVDEFHKKNFSYINAGLYSKQIKNFLNFFSKENMFFIIFETDFLKNRKNTIISLLNFLDVDPTVSLNLNVKSNSANIPKFKIVRDFIYKPNIIRTLGKYLIPSEILRRNIIAKIDNWNQIKISPQKLNNNYKNMLITKYFMNDIKELENIINRKLNIWYMK